MSLKHIYFQEGSALSYVTELQKQYGGEIKNNQLSIQQGRLNLFAEAINIFEGFELLLLNVDTPEKVVLHRTPDNNPSYIHLNVIKEGSYLQKYEDESTQMQVGSQNGVFIYDALFPITVEVPADSNLKLIGFKIDIKKKGIMEDAIHSIAELFKEESAVAYHAMLSKESERLFKDILFYNSLEKNRKALIVSRAIESFTILASNLEKLKSEDELNGLHIDDYERLQKIKNQLISNFEERISVENLAEEHGVSVSKLKRDFKTLFNSSVTQFYTNVKMDEAYRRLKSGDYSVSEVGYDMGYSNLSKFSEMFKKIKGLSPRDVLKVND